MGNEVKGFANIAKGLARNPPRNYSPLHPGYISEFKSMAGTPLRVLLTILFGFLLSACGSRSITSSDPPLVPVTPTLPIGANQSTSPPPASLFARCPNPPPLDPGGNRTDAPVRTHANLRVTDLVVASVAGPTATTDVHWGQGSRSGAEGLVYARKALEEQSVCVYAYLPTGWVPLSFAETDEEGKFEVPTASLPPGLTRLYLYVVSDRSGASFRTLVVDGHTKIIVSDIDGTLTQFELPQKHRIPHGAHVYTISTVPANPHASDALQHLNSDGYQIVYLTARADGATDHTRLWLLDNGFPDSILWLVPKPTGIPPTPFGNAAEYKTYAMQHRLPASTKIGDGIGNQVSDVKAYKNVGLAAQHIFIVDNDSMDPDELKGKACVFDTYGDLLAGRFNANLSIADCKFPGS
jgi:hypothetical protein